MTTAIPEPRSSVRPLMVGMSLLSESPAQFTGTARYVDELLRAFGRQPGEITVHALVDRPDARRLRAAAPNVSIHCASGYTSGRSRVSRVAALTAASIRPHRHARELPADVDVVHYPLTFDVPTVSSPTVLSFFDVQHHDLPQHYSRAQHLWRRVMYDRAARRATCVVTFSEHARARIIENVGIDPHRILVIPLGVNHERFRPEVGPNDEELLSALGLPDRFLLYPASLWPHKNHLRLLDALAALEDHEMALMLTGATFGKLDALVAEAERRGLGGRVRHLGYVSEEGLPALYRRATALVFPSLHEGFGFPTVEAMACGCPVASSREAALAEVCGAAIAPLEPRDPSQMTGVIERVAGDRGLRERLRREGLAWSARFTWERTVDGHLEAYRRTLELRDG